MYAFMLHFTLRPIILRLKQSSVAGGHGFATPMVHGRIIPNYLHIRPVA